MSASHQPAHHDGVPSFCQRLAHRRRIWWGTWEQWAEWRTYRDIVHRFGEWHSLRHRDDPESLWQCCPSWQRSVVQKWNGREYVARFGLESAKLYWRGRSFQRLPLEDMPPRYVIRSVMGQGRKRVWVIVDGVEILRREPALADALRWRVRRSAGWAMTVPLLLEEFLHGPSGEGRLPPEYKVYMFRDRIAAVQFVERHDIGAASMTQRCYSADWKPFDDPLTNAVPLAPLQPPPPGLDQLLRYATDIGQELGTFMRLDFFLTDRGWVFNEFCSSPMGGRHFTPIGDEYFGRMWLEACPDQA